jgi:DNA replication protein DnaC
MTIKELCTEIKLSFIRDNYDVLIQEADKTGQSYEEFLRELLENEYLNRIENSIKRRIREANFPQKVHLSDFNTTVYDPKYAADFDELKTLDFIERKANVILIGAAGAGKTYYSIALGMEACKKGLNVLFISVPDLIIRLREAMSNNQITALKRKFMRYHLIVIDELGYFSFDKPTAEVFFNLVSERHQNGSVIITSNLDFPDWVSPLGDTKLTTALVDRIHCKSHILYLEREVGGRMQETINWQRKKQTLDQK